MQQKKQVEKLLQQAQRKQNQLLGVLPNNQLDALIISENVNKRTLAVVPGMRPAEISLSAEDSKAGAGEDTRMASILAPTCSSVGPRYTDQADRSINLIDLKSMPTFADRPICAAPSAQDPSSVKLPLIVPFKSVPVCPVDRIQDVFTWPPERANLAEEDEDMLAWLGMQPPARMPILLPVTRPIVPHSVV